MNNLIHRFFQRRMFLFLPFFVIGVPFYLRPQMQFPKFTVKSALFITSTPSPLPTRAPSPTAVPTATPLPPTPTATPVPVVVTAAPTSVPAPQEENKYGVARKVEGSEYGYTMDVQDDATMASAQEIFDALNRYRTGKGIHALNWDNNLASFAIERANYFESSGLDEHRGFLDYVNNGDNRKKLGFWALGENASKGYKLSGTHLIEWVFAGDAPHDNNQLSGDWTDVGIGVNGTSVDLVFGGKRM